MRNADRGHRLRIAVLGKRGRSRLKWMKKETRQEERNRGAAIRYADRHGKGLEPLPDNSPLGQKLADRAIGAVVATLRVWGRYRDLVLREKLAILAAAHVRVIVMPGYYD